MKKLMAQHDYHIFKIKTLEMTVGGEQGIFYQIVQPDWVNIIAFHKGQLIVEKQFRIGCDQEILELPAGIIERDEGIIAAAERELLEETGYKGCGQLLSEMLPNPALQTNRCHTVLIPETTNTGQTQPDSFEVISTELMSLSEVEAAIMHGQFQNALHIASLYQYHLHQKNLFL
ncbi:NUDIX hydrolase [Macrococcus bovicus]|uniref:NUDIX hydrolase n=1 Tax=Macrococcus bovicus TaxID=69968 RepID=UPI0014075DAE|nr:NUDIX hydrolase [Macrococcus bovicus]WJP97646.1 NUDIX hydrolase [Macrococcus bovicus]